jgi:membrane glycosyltransferase
MVEPRAYSLHASLLPDETPNRRRRHYLEGLIFQLQDDGAHTLKANEKRALVSHREGLYELHTMLWAGTRAPIGGSSPGD